MECRQYELKNLLIAIDELGKAFGSNRDFYYTLGQYFRYTKTLLFLIESQKDPLAWILCLTCKKTTDVASFIYNLESYIYNYGNFDNFKYFLNVNGCSTILSFSYWKSF